MILTVKQVNDFIETIPYKLKSFRIFETANTYSKRPNNQNLEHFLEQLAEYDLSDRTNALTEPCEKLLREIFDIKHPDSLAFVHLQNVITVILTANMLETLLDWNNSAFKILGSYSPDKISNAFCAANEACLFDDAYNQDRSKLMIGRDHLMCALSCHPNIDKALSLLTSLKTFDLLDNEYYKEKNHRLIKCLPENHFTLIQEALEALYCHKLAGALSTASHQSIFEHITQCDTHEIHDTINTLIQLHENTGRSKKSVGEGLSPVSLPENGWREYKETREDDSIYYSDFFTHEKKGSYLGEKPILTP